MRKRRCPHHICSCCIVFRILQTISCCFAYTLDHSLCNRICQIGILSRTEISFNRMHRNIYCTACCLIRTYCISKNRILNCKIHTVKESVASSFLSCFRITDHAGRTHLRTGCCQCQDRALRKCLLWNSFTTMEIPDIYFRIRQSICNCL